MGRGVQGISGDGDVEYRRQWEVGRWVSGWVAVGGKIGVHVKVYW